jgi:hypothetical protein
MQLIHSIYINNVFIFWTIIPVILTYKNLCKKKHCYVLIKERMHFSSLYKRDQRRSCIYAVTPWRAHRQVRKK